MRQQSILKTNSSWDFLFLRMHSTKLIGIMLWVMVIAAYFYYAMTNHLTLMEVLSHLASLLSSPYGPLIYIVIFTFTPLIFFFSTSVLAVVGGAMFGTGSLLHLFLAIAYTVIGCMSAATIAYYVGLWLGDGLLPEKESAVNRYTDRIRKNSFETILLMHALFLPYEPINYLAGILRISLSSFLTATFLGSLPGLFAFVSFGASMDIKEIIAGKRPHLEPQMLLFSLAIFVLSLLGARYLRRYRQNDPNAAS